MERISLVFVGGIDRDCGDRVIRMSLNKFGTIIDGTIINIFISKKVGIGRGFAFVQFKHEKDAMHLIKLNTEQIISGRRVYMAWADKPPRLQSSPVRVDLKGN